jgi:sugar porter (SP) family MFS transporter
MINLPSWKKSYGVHEGSDEEANIVSMVQIGCVLGSLLAFLVVDRWGRLRSMQISCAIWLLGNLLWTVSAANIPLIYVGRFISGIGIGAMPVYSPTYLVEIAPKTIRGAAVLVYSGSVYIGILLGYFTNYGVVRNVAATNMQWRIPLALNFIFAGLLFIGSFFCVESPRWLLKKGRTDEGTKALCWLRQMPADHPYLAQELSGVTDQIHEEREATAAGFMGAVKSLFCNGSNLFRLGLAIMIQVAGQFSGGGNMTIYAPRIIAFTLHGAKVETKLLSTAVFGIIKLISSIAAAVFLIDLLGRKRSVLTGLTMQAICSIILGVFIKKNVVDKTVTAANETAGDQAFARLALAAIYLSGVAWSLGVNAVQYVYGTEIFGMQCRALATSVVMGESRLMPRRLPRASGASRTTRNRC